MQKENPFQELALLYDALPSVPCRACGDCCVSPTCTLLEFIALMTGAMEAVSRAGLAKLLEKEPLFHPAYEGNLRCVFQDAETRRCLVHQGRTLACRLFGLPALDRLKITNLENCRKISLAGVDGDLEQLRGWLSRLAHLNESMACSYCEPYWVAGLNLECWLAVYFDPLMNEGIFGELRRILRQHLDLDFFAAGHRDRTGLKEKTDRIALLYELIKTGDKSSSLELVREIRQAYPYTGTYYLEELDRIEKMLTD